MLRWAFSRCGRWGVTRENPHSSSCGGGLLMVVASLVVEHKALGRPGFSRGGKWAQSLWLTGSRTQAQELWCTGSAAP